jgi:hypothetical protein
MSERPGREPRASGARYLATVLKHAHRSGPVKLAEPTRELWWHTYPQLTQPADGLTGQLTARAEAHTIRLALLYALLDATNTIGPEHLTAALALWDYAARSAAWAINHTTGNPLAEQIHAALARSPDGLTRTQLRDLLPQPPRRTRRASTPHTREHRQSNPTSNPHSRTPRRALDRRTRAGLLTTLPPPRTSLPPKSGERNEHTFQLWSLCRSVVTRHLVTIQRDAAITILAVRQHHLSHNSAYRRDLLHGSSFCVRDARCGSSQGTLGRRG